MHCYALKDQCNKSFMPYVLWTHTQLQQHKTGFHTYTRVHGRHNEVHSSTQKEVLFSLLFKNRLSFIRSGLNSSHAYSTISTSKLIIQRTSSVETRPTGGEKKHPERKKWLNKMVIINKRLRHFLACKEQHAWSETMISEKKSRKPRQPSSWGLSHSPTRALRQTDTQASPTTGVFTPARCWLSCGNGVIY